MMCRRLLFVASFAFLLPACSQGPRVEMDTSKGKIVVELDPMNAPGTVENFLKYVDDKHYDNTKFHRVIADFMIQGGGFEPGPAMREKPTKYPKIRNEAINGLSNKRGTIAMARTSDPDSATAQFFINVKDNESLDYRLNPGGKIDAGYAVFGRVVQGMDVVDEIRAVRTTTVDGHQDVPAEDVVLKSVRRLK